MVAAILIMLGEIMLLTGERHGSVEPRYPWPRGKGLGGTTRRCLEGGMILSCENMSLSATYE